MHISEGFLSVQALAAGWAAAGVGIAFALKKTDMDKIVRVAAMSSVFFLASLLNVKIGPSSMHLSMLAPVGLVLGWGCFPAIAVALLLQAVLFQFGGILVLGVNITCMATPSLAVYLLFSKFVRGERKFFSAAASFAAGFAAIVFSSLLAALFIGMSDANLIATAKLLVWTHIPLAFAEGFITLFFAAFLRKVAPDFLAGVA